MQDTFFIQTSVPSSKNNKWVKPDTNIILSGAATGKYYSRTKKQFNELRPLFLKALEGLEPPYYIELTFYRETKHKFDYINMAQIVCDAMKKREWLPDDNTEWIKPYFGDVVYVGTYKENGKKAPNPKAGVAIKVLRQRPIHFKHLYAILQILQVRKAIENRDADLALKELKTVYDLLKP